MSDQDNTAIKLREAIKQSFNKLYVKQFTTGWQEARMIRGIEIDLLDLSAIQQHTETAYQKGFDDGAVKYAKTLKEIQEKMRLTNPTEAGEK